MSVDFIAGTLAGFVGKIIEYPFDTVKVRLQVAGGGGAGAAASAGAGAGAAVAAPPPPVAAAASFNGPLDCLRRTIAAEGPAALYKGVTFPMVGTMSETAILFAAYSRMEERLRAGDPALRRGDLPLAQKVLCGAGAGLAVSWVLTPIELIKCRMQQPPDAMPAGQPAFRGPVDCLLRSVRGEGWRVLYKGHVATMTREVPGTACWFGAYEAFLDAMTPRGQAREDVAPATTIAAGALGGMAYWGIFYPGDTVKSTVQTAGKGVDSSLLGTVRRIHAAHGVGGFYRGFGITMLRAAPANAAVFFTYETIAKTLTKREAEGGGDASS